MTQRGGGSAGDSGPAPAVGRAGVRHDDVAPDGSEVRHLLGSAHGATRASVVEISLAPGRVSRAVRHATVEEYWYVVAGAGEVWRAPDGADLAPAKVAAGDALVIPTGWRFQFRTVGDAPLRFVCVTVPPWPGASEASDAGAGPFTIAPEIG